MPHCIVHVCAAYCTKRAHASAHTLCAIYCTWHTRARAQLGMVERLEQALREGRVPSDARGLANTLYLDLHAARRMAVEREFGKAAGSLASPAVFQT